ncbi:hypothetical protein BpHYR1_049886 [Brachionus plicatilis]|uniref:HAT C-terminal dimerisation domain-containing protein n=1 Tax=Brachionus plicatilis TaxID=10195 RepID=A0A3M7QEX3_BRAPC|nr:hypothetical protein BpHYR1_049886 [Brachionus plicatilis]
MPTDRTNFTNTQTTTSFNQKKRKEIEPKSWLWLHYASKTHRGLAKCRICLKETMVLQVRFQKIPILSQVCELIYCVTATSVPSENLFRNAGLVQNDQRNRMELSALNMYSQVWEKTSIWTWTLLKTCDFRTNLLFENFLSTIGTVEIVIRPKTFVTCHYRRKELIQTLIWEYQIKPFISIYNFFLIFEHCFN